MKTLFIKLLTFLFSMMLIFSCTNYDELDDFKNKSLSYDDFFQKVSSLNNDIVKNDEKVIRIDYEFNSKNKTIKLLKHEQRGLKVFIVDYPAEESLVADNAYKVTCVSESGDDMWVEECDGKWSCGPLIAKCLDSGGCATMCRNTMVYMPQTRTFYLFPNNFDVDYCLE